LPLRIDGCRNLLFANAFFYRFVSSFVHAPYAVTVTDSREFRQRAEDPNRDTAKL
jgi:hypothetical protein